MTLAACISTGATLALASPSMAAPPPGDNGTVKVHRSTTSADDMRNEPKVCTFYLVGFQFDPAQQVSWYIKSWPPTGERKVVLKDTLTLDADGHGRTTDLTLPDGHYKLFWNFAGEHGAAKHKVFWVKCPAPTPSPSPSGGGNPGGPPPSATPTVKPTTDAPSPSPSAPSPSASTPSGDETSPLPPHRNVSDNGNTGGGLPFTGFPAAVAGGIALVLVLGGGAAMLISRRMRGSAG
jgi:hypothetical protein